MKVWIVFIVWLLAVGAVPERSAAQGAPRRVEPASTLPKQLEGVGIDQRLGERLPLDAFFRDEEGRTVRLRDYFGVRPVVLALAYYDCPMLCTQVLNGLTSGLRPLPFTAGQEFEVVVVSFNPENPAKLAAAKKAQYIEHYGRPGAASGWHFLTGDEPSISALARAAGFRYRRDDTTGQYIHASAIMLATPDGTLSRYLYGVEYSPRDLRLGLVEASAGRIGSPVDRVMLFCFHYDPSTGKYTMLTLKLVRLGGLATVVGFLAFVMVSRRKDRRTANLARRTANPAPEPGTQNPQPRTRF